MTQNASQSGITLPTRSEAEAREELGLRRQIVQLMKERARCTAKSKHEEWRRLTNQIDSLQRQVDRLRKAP